MNDNYSAQKNAHSHTQHAIAASLGLLLIVCALAGCSTKHNTGLSRNYQKLTSHFNVYFNASEAFDMGIDNIRKSYTNDYSHVLPVYEFSSVTAASAGKGDMETVLKKSHKLVQLHSITVKPEGSPKSDEEKRFYAKSEFNPYVPEAYLLMGKANVVMHEEQEAIKLFDFLNMKHETERPAYEGKIWKSIAYTQLGQYNNAIAALKSYDMDGIAPRNLYADYQAAYANIYIAQSLYKEAIPFMEKAVDNVRDHQVRRRYTYILAQLYRAVGDKEKAAPLFLKLSRGMQDYDMAFAAKLDLGTVATTPEELAKAEKTLQKMAADPKNEDNLDQIYYAIGNMESNKGNQPAAIDAFRKSVKTSVSNDNQKGLSFLALGDIFQAMPEYIEASTSLDSAAFYLSTDNDRKDEADKRSNLLAPLAKELRTVRDNDSLLRLARLPESVRNAIIDQMVRADQERRQAEQEAREADQENAMSQSEFNQMNRNQNNNGRKSSWYFYNTSIVSAGKSTFRTKWGARKNEDNWRRADKSSNNGVPDNADANESANADANANSSGANAEGQIQKELAEKETGGDKALSREGLLAGLPLTPQQQETTEAATAQALLRSAQLLYDDLHDYDRCVEQLKEYVRRYPQASNRYDALTLLHFAQVKAGDSNGILQTDKEIIAQYPESMMAKNLTQNGYLESLAEAHNRQEQTYQQSYAQYLQNDFASAIEGANKALAQDDTEELYRPRYLLLRALSHAKLANKNDFRADLETIHSQHASTAQDSVATILLAELDKGREPIRYVAYDSPLSQKESETVLSSAQKAQYTYEPDSVHVIVCFVDNGKLKDAQFLIADYNFSNYILRDYDLSMKHLPMERQAIVIGKFANRKDASTYFYALREQSMWKDLSSAPLPEIFLMSETNYRLMTLTGPDEAFMLFIQENYK